MNKITLSTPVMKKPRNKVVYQLSNIIPISHYTYLVKKTVSTRWTSFDRVAKSNIHIISTKVKCTAFIQIMATNGVLIKPDDLIFYQL